MAERLEMTTVSYLLDNFINYFIIIVIVVFQQDIRRALMRIGQNVSRFGRTHAISHALDEVLAAAAHLAKVRMGGIVVFEREANLDEFLDHGEVVDAQISKELLVALFVPSRDNELHDGAIVIRDLRLHRAGAVLPLSQSELSSEFGTRHRAGLGITEETDSVAIVISEETRRGEPLHQWPHRSRSRAQRPAHRAPEALREAGHEAETMTAEAHAAVAFSKAVAAMASSPEVEPKASGDRSGTVVEATPRSVTTTESLRAATSAPVEET